MAGRVMNLGSAGDPWTHESRKICACRRTVCAFDPEYARPRLAALAPVAAEKLAGQRLADVAEKIKATIDPNVRREQMARVTTDECGRFCVWVPRFDIDDYLKWRLERRCYLGWLRRPSLEDVLRAREVLPKPQPDPGPIELNEHLLEHAARVIDVKSVARLRGVSKVARPGPVMTRVDPELARAAFLQRTRPPLTADAAEALSPRLRARLAARAGVPLEMLAKLDPKRAYGPFLRCREIVVPQWSSVLDVPDISFEVTQDVNGDGQPEVIYGDGLFEVRWDANNIADVVLHADAIAVTSASCDIPEVDTSGEVAILFASNYPLQVAGNPSDYHDGVSGYAKLPNRPDADGIPGGTRSGTRSCGGRPGGRRWGSSRRSPRAAIICTASTSSSGSRRLAGRSRWWSTARRRL